MKFGIFMQNITRITAIWSKWEPEVEFQYGGYCFSQTEIIISLSTDYWAMSTKFCRRRHFDLLMTLTSTNTKPEVVLSHGGGHVKNRYDVITPPQMARFEWHFAGWCRITCWLRGCGRGRNRKKNFSMVDAYFSKSEIVISQRWIELSWRNLVCWQVWTIWRKWLTQTEAGSKIAP